MPNKHFTDKTSQVGLVILAAGAASRMGSPKQLLPLNGESLIRRMTRTALQSLAHPVIVVLGAYREELSAQLAEMPVQIVDNPDWNEGMASSIRVGIGKLVRRPEPIRAVVITVCDQPLVTPTLINELIAVYQTDQTPVVAAEYAGQLGVPALFSRALFSELLLLQGADGAKKIIRKYAADARSIHFPGGSLDVDTPEDYQRMLQLIAPAV